jgi:folate-dependent phosphoribosylglycinamide formyltransferase PurN
MPSSYSAFPGSKAVDNDFETFAHTSGTEVPWINIEISESAIIKTVVVIIRP